MKTLPYILLLIFWGVVFYLLAPVIGTFLMAIGFIFVTVMTFFIFSCVNLKKEF